MGLRNKYFGEIPDDGRFYRIVSRKYVCFKCRQLWRPYRWERSVTNRTMSVCPNCKGKLIQIYPMFKAPKKRDKKAWKEVLDIVLRGKG